MIIQIENEIIEIKNDLLKTGNCFDAISEILRSKNLELRYLIVDGVQIDSNYKEYFAEYNSEIKKIDVIVMTLETRVMDMLYSTKVYLNSIIPQLRRMAEEFYQQPKQQTWAKIVDLFEGIQWILETVVKIDAIQRQNEILQNYEKWNEYVQTIMELNLVIPELEIAMRSKDNILIGDLQLYELLPIFEKSVYLLEILVINKVSANVS